jgi:serine/threonine protein kinase
LPLLGKIAHLDLKPDNILVVVDETGVPKIKIIDFGLASFFKDFTPLDI